MNISDITKQAIQHAMSSIEDASGPLTPFTMLLDETHPDPRESKLTLARQFADYLEEALHAAQSSISPGGVHSMYAIAWDGFVTLDERKWDAILVEVGTSASPEATILAQRYEAKETGFFNKKRRNVSVGAPHEIGTVLSRLHASAA